METDPVKHIFHLFVVLSFFQLMATNSEAVNLVATETHLSVNGVDVTDNLLVGDIVSLDGRFSWSGLTTRTSFLVYWWMDFQYAGAISWELNPETAGSSGSMPLAFGVGDQMWTATEGEHYLLLTIDAGDTVSESNESDNEALRQFVVTTPNEAPTDISLSASSINENVAANSTVGTLSTTDPDTGNTFTYTLVSGTGSTDNGAFNINGSSLRITASPNYEAKNSYGVRVRTTDQGGLWYEEAFTITINDVNETPTDIALSAVSINENVGANSTVGTLSTTDPDTGNTFTYTLVSGTGSTDNGAFNISGSNQLTAAIFNYEVKSTYSIRVQSTDQDGLSTQIVFAINIVNVNEPPPSFSELPTLSNGNMIIRWGSITNKKYTVYYSTNLITGFSVLQSNIPGTPAVNSYTDTLTVVTQKYWKVTTDP